MKKEGDTFDSTTNAAFSLSIYLYLFPCTLQTPKMPSENSMAHVWKAIVLSYVSLFGSHSSDSNLLLCTG